MLLAQYARRDVTVVLTGEGADEVFGGYSNYVKRLAEERITGVLGAPGSPLPALLRRLPPRIARDRILKAAAQPRARRYTTIPNIFDVLLRAEYFTAPFAAAAHARVADSAEAFYAECDSPAYLDHLLDIDARLWLPDDLLAKVDRATMAFSLEARVPYLDHEFYGWCARLDPALKINGAHHQVHPQGARRALPSARHRAPEEAGLHDAARALARERAQTRHRGGPRPRGARRGAGCCGPKRSRASSASTRRAGRTTRCASGCC